MVPFVGPSYSLTNRKAGVSRAVNLYLLGLETPSKAPWILEEFPGLVLFSTLAGPVRGGIEAAGRCFFVAGSTLYELDSAGAATNRGTLSSSSGRVEFAWGTTQLVLVDGANGYVFTLASNAFGQITDPDWRGSSRVGYLSGRFFFVDPGTGQHYASAIDDATNLNALDYATAESSPDPIVGHVIDHGQALFFGTHTVESWSPQGGDYPLSRDSGTILQVGAIAGHTIQRIDNGVMWVGRDENGGGIVYRLVGMQPQRASTVAVEQALQRSTDLSSAYAYAWQRHGLTFYAIKAPGVTSTWVYSVASGTWSEMCDLDNGNLVSHRADCHVYAFGKNLVGDEDGKVYYMSESAYTWAGDPKPRIRVSPNYASPKKQRFSEFTLDTNVGEASQGQTVTVELSWSDDGGFTWGNPVARTFVVGQYDRLLRWHRLGIANDRVWQVRCTDNAPFSIVNASIR